MKKKLISLLLCGALSVGAAGGLTACVDRSGLSASYSYDITVWVGENSKSLTAELIDEFNRTNTRGIYFKANVNEVTEGRAAGDVISKPQDAPEIFCFAQDQLARLVNKGLLTALNTSMTKFVNDNNSASAANAVSVGGTMYAYPLTEDNGYFLYYDKSIVSDTQAQTIEGIVEACEAQEKRFSFNLTGDGAGWYTTSFFYGAGAKSEWTVNENGKFTDKDDDFNTEDKGLVALKGIQKVVKSTSYIKNGKASDFAAAQKAGAVVSGIWDYQAAKSAVGDENLGIAKLPTYTVGEQTYQLVSFLGCKMMGITKQTNATKASALALLVQHLTNEKAQAKRYTTLGWGPSNKTAAAADAVVNDKALSALKESATVPQGQFPANWWAKTQVLGIRAEGATSDTALLTALSDYENSLAELLNDDN